MIDFLDAIVLITNYVLVPGIAYGSQLALGALGVTLVLPGLALAQADATPTYSKDVAPIFRDKCEACHRPGYIAPMSLQTAMPVFGRARVLRCSSCSRAHRSFAPGSVAGARKLASCTHRNEKSSFQRVRQSVIINENIFW